MDRSVGETNRLRALERLGQSVWVDELRRGMLSAQLPRLVGDDGVSGITSNPTLFAKAFVEDSAYRENLAALRRDGQSGQAIYEQLSVDDVRAAAEQLRKMYEATDGHDGYVSIEVPPSMAHDAEATVTEAHRLRAVIDRPNVMIKVPATDAGLVALRRLISAGVSVNVTLIFGTRRYRQVAEAFMSGLEDRAPQGPLVGIASVASLFVSRIDTLVDKKIDAIENIAERERAQALRGRAAIAVARLAYQEYQRLIASPRWQSLAARGAQPQRLLWASTGTKDAHYSDVKYVDGLIGRDTVTTVPLQTLAAFRDHGTVMPTLENHLSDAAAVPADLQALGIDLDAVAAQLEREGLAAFAASMTQMLQTLAA